jgi:hypothetical protein
VSSTGGAHCKAHSSASLLCADLALLVLLFCAVQKMLWSWARWMTSELPAREVSRAAC